MSVPVPSGGPGSWTIYGVNGCFGKRRLYIGSDETSSQETKPRVKSYAGGNLSVGIANTSSRKYDYNARLTVRELYALLTAVGMG